MNRKARRQTQSLANREPKITFGGASYTLDEMHALALQKQNSRSNREAIDLYRLILAKAPDHTKTLNNLGLLLYQLEDIDDAIKLYRLAIKYRPEYPFAYHNLGDAMVSKGDMKTAEKLFRKALSLKPDLVQSLHSLVKMKNYQSLDHPEIRQIQSLLASMDDTQPNKEHLYFALGKVYDDVGHYDEAFAAIQRANQLCHKYVSYIPDEEVRDSKAILEVFSEEFMGKALPFASSSTLPVFIVGMPRSGTTLLANILSNHPLIEAVGELPTIIESTQRLAELVGNGLDYPQAAQYLTPAITAELIGNYEKRLRHNVSSKIRYIVDKHPINFYHLGFIKTLFPHAHIIHCTRDPMDTCFSNYLQYFSPDYNYSFELKNIGNFYSIYTKMMAHWQSVMPTEILEVSYEETVSDTEAVARKAIDFLGLAWNERCASPHTNPRVVKTASVWQVRQPVYHKSVGRWKHYEKHLGPLMEALKIADD